MSHLSPQALTFTAFFSQKCDLDRNFWNASGDTCPVNRFEGLKKEGSKRGFDSEEQGAPKNKDFLNILNKEGFIMTTNTENLSEISNEAANSNIEDIIVPLAKRMDRFLAGEMVLSELYGVSKDELWGIAQSGGAMIDNGRLEEAQKIFEGLTALDPYESYYHTALGCVYQRQEKLEDANKEYERAAFLSTSDLVARANRVEVLVQLERYDDAVKQTEELTVLDPKANSEATQRAVVLVSAIYQSI